MEMRVLASYLFPICIGYGYGLDSGTNVARAYQSKKKKKKFFYSRYSPDTFTIWWVTSWTREKKEKGKKLENKEIWVEISTATGHWRLSQVTAGPGSSPLVVSPLLLLRLSPHLFLSSPSLSFSLFSTFSCFCFMCLGSNGIMCIPNKYSYNKKSSCQLFPKSTFIYFFSFSQKRQHHHHLGTQWILKIEYKQTF